MGYALLADRAVTVTELKRSPTSALDSGRGRPVAIMNHNQPTHYAVTAQLWEKIRERLDDAELNAMCNARAGERRIPVSLDEL